MNTFDTTKGWKLSPVLDEERLEWAFNEWLRRYTENPAEFEREFQFIGEFLQEQSEGKPPSYGQRTIAYLKKLIEEKSK